MLGGEVENIRVRKVYEFEREYMILSMLDEQKEMRKELSKINKEKIEKYEEIIRKYKEIKEKDEKLIKKYKKIIELNKKIFEAKLAEKDKEIELLKAKLNSKSL